MGLSFAWDPAKARRNLAVHGVTFDEASTVFKDPLSVTVEDPLHSDDEDRVILIGISESLKLLVVVHTDRGDTIRIISARSATAAEREQYEEHEK